MVRPFALRALAATFLILALGVGCGSAAGGACGGLLPLPKDPKPLGFPTDQLIEGGIQARITDQGMNKLTATIPSLIKGMLGSGFCAIPPTTQTFGTTCFNVDVGACNGNGCAGGKAGCPANLMFTSADGLDTVKITIGDGDNPIIHVEFTFDVEVPLEIDYGGQLFCAGGSGSCFMDIYSNHYYGNGGSAPIDIVVDIQTGTDPTTGELTLNLANIDAKNIDLGADGDNSWPANMNNGCGSFLGTILNDVLGAFKSSLGNTILNFVLNLLKPQINQLIQSFLPKPLGIAGTFDAGRLLQKFHPPDNTNLEMFIVPGGYVAGSAGGLTLGVMSGLNSDRDQTTRTPGLTSEAALCVPNRPVPDLAAAPWMLPYNAPRKDFLLTRAGEFSGNPDPVDAMNKKEDVAIGISRTFLDLAGFHLYNSGTLCLAIGGDAIPQLNAGTLSVIIGSLGNIIEDRQAPLALVLRPTTPINFTLGAGTMDDPLVHMAVQDMRIDFYAWLEERYVRLLTLGIDLNVGLNLTVTKNAAGAPALQPTLVGLDAKNITIRVSNTDLLQEKPDDLAKVFPSLLNIATGALGGAIPTVALPAVAGFSLDDLIIQRVQTTQDDFLGIFGTIVTGHPDGLVNWTNPLEPRPAVDELDTVARVAAVEVPGADQLKALFSNQDVPVKTEGARPKVTLDLDVNGHASGPVEWAWRIDGGMWRPWTQEPHPVLAEDAFLLQGHHGIDVRSRVVGDWRTEDSTPAHLDVLIDSVPPELHPAKSDDGTRVVFGGFDLVTPAKQLVYSWLDANGKRTDWSAQDGLTLDEARALTDEGRKLLQLFAKDEAGNIGQTAVDLGPLLGWHGRTTSPPPPSGCGCRVGGAGTRGDRAALVVGALLLLVLLRRQRAKAKAALATLALAALALHAAGCGCDQKAPLCTVDDDCRNMKCTANQIPQCQAHMCICTPDLPPGDTGRFSSMSLIGPEAYVSAYNNTYGDLMIGHVLPPGVVTNWDYVDGVPDGTPDVTGSHVRGGIMEKGDDVGRYTSIQSTPDNQPVMAYYDKTHGALKFASFGVVRWHAHVVDKGTSTPSQDNGDDVGRWASLTLSADGTPAIAYTAIVHEGTKSGVPESQLRWAQATTKIPQQTSDWTISVLDSRPLGSDGTDGGIVDMLPPPATDDGGMDGGSSTPAAPGDVLLPEAIAIMSATARKSDGSPGVVYYDRTRGNLRYVEWIPSANAWSIPQILDGEDKQGNDLGDVGLYPAITYDTQDVAHVAYENATHDRLMHIDTMSKTPEIVDDGYRPTDETTLDGLAEPVYHLVGDSASIQIISGILVIAYQDSTVVELRVAQKDLTTQGSKWNLATVAGHAMNPFSGSFGFYASLRAGSHQAVVSSYAINQQLDSPLYFVEVFAVDLGLVM